MLFGLGFCGSFSGRCCGEAARRVTTVIPHTYSIGSFRPFWRKWRDRKCIWYMA